MSSTVQHPPLLSLQETADRLSVSVKTVRRLVAAGRFPALRVGGQLRVDELDLQAWLEEGRVNPAERRVPDLLPRQSRRGSTAGKGES